MEHNYKIFEMLVAYSANQLIKQQDTEMLEHFLLGDAELMSDLALLIQLKNAFNSLVEEPDLHRLNFVLNACR